MVLAGFPALASGQLICAADDDGSSTVSRKASHVFRVASDLKENFGAAIDTSLVPRTQEEIDTMSETFVFQSLSSLERIGATPLWTNDPPYFDIEPAGGGFAVNIANRDGPSTLFLSERKMHQTELVFTFDYFLTRSLGDCRLALRDPEFASLHYKLATFWLEYWCKGDGIWFKSKICGEELMRLEIDKFESAYQTANTQAVELAGELMPREAYFVATYLKEWAENLSRLKHHWCQTYSRSDPFC